VTGCPRTATLAGVGGKWKLVIVSWLAESPRHLAALQKLIPRLSQKVLTWRLRELIDDALLVRHAAGQPPVPVEYSVTAYGRSVLPLVNRPQLGSAQFEARSRDKRP
jgi:DNA-binding HxlR family transcriptional regulator